MCHVCMYAVYFLGCWAPAVLPVSPKRMYFFPGATEQASVNRTICGSSVCSTAAGPDGHRVPAGEPLLRQHGGALDFPFSEGPGTQI